MKTASLVLPLAVAAFMPVFGEETKPKVGITKVETRNKSRFAEGGTAYLRVKQWAAKPSVEAYTPAKDDATPQGPDLPLNFGQAVTLIRHKEGPPTMWLVSADKGQGWLPAYLLTPEKAEIEFLKSNERIPETMSFIYKTDEVRVWGCFRVGPLVLESYGLGASAAGSRQVAFKGNAVLFEESAVTHAWKNPMLFSKGNATNKVRSTCLYYCTGVDDKGTGSFDCIDLTNLTFLKE